MDKDCKYILKVENKIATKTGLEVGIKTPLDIIFITL